VLADWVKKNSDKIVFKRMHMGDDAQAKAFYTLEAMNAWATACTKSCSAPSTSSATA
jgi:hypothetical protein